MKAIVQARHPSPDDALELREVEEPEVGDDEVLVRVRATSANTYNMDLPAGLRYIGRIAVTLRGPKIRVPGLDLAGQVEAIGNEVERFQPGDEVFGWSEGSFAEYVSVSEDALPLKPVNLPFEEAAVVPMSAFTALQGLRDKGEIQPGQKVLIIGASGGVGTFAVQIAKSFGADMTGVCSTRNVQMVRSIGADHVIDYSEEDITRSEQRYDLILDMAGDRSPSDLRRVLTPRGTLVMIGSAGLAGSGSLRLWLRGIYRWLAALVLSLFVRQRLRALFQTRSAEDLIVLKELIEAGKVTPVISARYSLSEAPEAIRRLEEGHGQGKSVIIV